MKKLILLLALLPGLAGAAEITVAWTLPTVAQDGSPLTGANVLTSVQVFLSTTPNATMTTPTVTLTPSSSTTTQTFPASAGQTIYARVKACNSAGCSPYSNEAGKIVPTSPPGVPTSVTITIS